MAGRKKLIFFGLLLTISGLGLLVGNLYFQFLLLSGISAAGLTMRIVHMRGILLACSSLFLSLLLAELVLAAISPENYKYFSPNHYSSYNSVERPYGAIPQPGVHEAGKVVNGTQIYKVKYTIGNNGFRHTPGQTPGPNNTIINMFGGSFTFGEGLNDRETLPYFLAHEIPQTIVNNFAMHGWGVHNALSILETLAPEGDINVVVTFARHAERSACKTFYGSKHPRFVGTALEEIVQVGKCHESPGYKYTLRNAWLRSKSKLFHRAIAVNRPPRSDIQLYLAILKKMFAVSKERGQLFAIGYIRDTPRYLPWDITNEEIFQALADSSDLSVDITLGSDLSNLKDSLRLHALDNHPSALANKQRAHLLAQELIKLTGTRTALKSSPQTSIQQ